MHEDVAIDFAQWLSVDFRLWVNDRIRELLRYGMSVTPEVVEHAADVGQLGVDLLTAMGRLEHPEEEDPPAVVVQVVVTGLADEIYINHGPGCGIDTTWSRLPVEVWRSMHLWNPQKAMGHTWCLSFLCGH